MNAKLKLSLSGLALMLAAIGLALSSRDRERPASWGASASRIETPNVGQASRLSSERPSASDTNRPAPANQAGGTPALRRGEEAPGWAIPYGKEFWRRAIKPDEPKPQDPRRSTGTMPANIDLGDIIERVSHAITQDETSAIPRVQAKTYTATLDGSGVRFSPRRPASSALATMHPRLEFRDTSLDTANESQTTPILSSALRPSSIWDNEQSLLTSAATTHRFSERTTLTGFPEPDPHTQVTLRTRSIRLGDRVLYERTARPLDWFLHGNTAQALLDEGMALVEHWETGADGVRVSWVLNRNPLKSLTKNASCPVAGQASRLTGERASASDPARPASPSRAGETPALPSLARIFHTLNACLRRESRRGRQAGSGDAGSGDPAYRDWLGPVVGRVPSRGRVSPIQSACEPSGLNALEIQLEIEGLSFAVASGHGNHLADAAGTPRVRIGKAVAVDSAGWRSEVAMVANDGRLCVRVPREILDRAAYPLAIDPLISPEFGMDQPVIVPRPGEHQIPAVAWNGTNWLVVWTEWPVFESPVDVVGARVSKEGAVLDPFGILIRRGELPPAAPAVASNGKDYFVVWEHFDFVTATDIYGARVTADGEVAEAEGIVINGLPNDQFAPSVAGDSEGYVVVWKDRRTGGDADIYGTRVSNEGAVLDGEGFPISRAPGEQSQPSVARGPTGFLVVWSDWRQKASNGSDVYGARLGTNRTVLDLDGVPICTAPNDQWFPRVAGNSTGHLVVWQDSRSTGNVEQNDIYATLVSSNGVVSHPQGIAVNTATGNQNRPAIAVGSDDFLVVWNDSGPVQPGIYAARIRSDGILLDPEGVLVDLVPKTFFPAVAASDNGFFAVWMRSSRPEGGFGSGILGARLNSRTEVIDTEPILVTPKDNDQNSPAVASNGTNWLVVWQDWRSTTNRSGIYGVRIGYDGAVLDTAAIPISTQPGLEMEPTVASANGDYLVAWIDDRNAGFPFTDIYGTRVRGDGTVMDPGGIAICTAQELQSHPAVTSDGTNYLVAWDDARVTSRLGIYAARVRRDGVVQEPNGFPITERTDAQSTPVVAFNGQNFLVVWTEWYLRPQPQYDIWGARVSVDGAVLDPAGISISHATNAQTAPAIASAGSNFLVIWRDTRNTVTTNGYTFGGHLYGTQVTSDGSVLDSDGFLISTGAFLAHPALVFNGIDFFAVWDASPVPSTNRQIHAAWMDPGGRVLLTDVMINTNANASYPAIAAGPSNNFLVIGEGWREGASRVFGHLVTLAGRPALKTLTLSGSMANLSWLAEAGKTYRVQFKPDLSNTNWLDLEPLVTATNSTASLQDPTIGQNAQRFYRVVLLP